MFGSSVASQASDDGDGKKVMSTMMGRSVDNGKDDSK